jgi:uncharacterized membrane protein
MSWSFRSLFSPFVLWLNRRAGLVLALLTLLYALIFAAAAVYKFHSFWMGFDLGVHEQVLWNTAHGRLAAISPKGATSSYLGVDIVIVELLLASLYALVPRTETMLILQVLLAASGAVPLFLLARDRAGAGAWGVFAALLYLAALPVQYAILYEFQIRTVGTVLFLWAFLFFERRRFWPFLAAGVLAIWTRSDGGFALAAMGGYALIHRRRWPWVVVPGVVGVGWLLLCLKVLIPAFREDNGFLYGFVYSWLGDTPLEMVYTLVARPAYVLEHVATPEKGGYLLALFAPLLFLPLLRPDIMLIGMPSLLLNLLSPEHIHWSIRYHYQAFVIPFLLVAALYALIPVARQEEHTAPARPAWLLPGAQWRVLLVGALLAVTLGAQLVLRSPLIHLFTRERDAQRIALAAQLVEQIPPEASVTATSALGAHLARRRELYFFPGNVIYPPAFVERGRYLLADLREVGEGGEAKLRRLQQSDRWHTLVEKQEFLLLEKTTSNSLASPPPCLAARCCSRCATRCAAKGARRARADHAHAWR